MMDLGECISCGLVEQVCSQLGYEALSKLVPEASVFHVC